MTICSYCRTSKLIKSDEYIYCPTCESYFTQTNVKQKHAYVKIEDTDQITLYGNLCDYCEKKYNTEKYITCQTFNDYLYGLNFCTKCRIRNLKFLKNSYNKSFLLYKAKEKVFSYWFIMFVFLIWTFIYSSDIVFFITVLFIYLKMRSGLFKSVVCATFFTIMSIYIPIMSYTYLVYLMLVSKMDVFKIPQNLEKSTDIDLHIQSLSLAPK
jgi:hypothetical protein